MAGGPGSLSPTYQSDNAPNMPPALPLVANVNEKCPDAMIVNSETSTRTASHPGKDDEAHVERPARAHDARRAWEAVHDDPRAHRPPPACRSLALSRQPGFAGQARRVLWWFRSRPAASTVESIVVANSPLPMTFAPHPRRAPALRALAPVASPLCGRLVLSAGRGRTGPVRIRDITSSTTRDRTSHHRRSCSTTRMTSPLGPSPRPCR